MAGKKKEAERLKKKLGRLIALLKRMRAVLIAYSGGVDSSLLLKIARQALGDNVLAVTVDSPIYPQEELKFARRITASWGVNHKVVKANLFKNPSFIKNSVNRCYHCKRELFKRLWNIAASSRINFVLDGSNASDYQDFRPGNQAKREFRVRSPLQECAINKRDIYRLSKIFGLSTSNKPATVCFASRIPYGQPIILKDINMVKQAEAHIRGLGFQQVRVRHYNLGASLKLARIELDTKDIRRAINRYRLQIMNRLNGIGYDYITLDLEGYRLGSLNKFIRA